MARIGICTPTISYGDAVSNDVLGMNHVFSKKGHETYIFARENFVNDTSVYGLDDVKKLLTANEDIFVYHHSVGWDVGMSVFSGLDCRKVLKYHNVTPPEYFKGIAENYVTACSSGRDQLKELIDIAVDLYLCDSDYNLNELCEAGIKHVHSAVVPPFHHVDRLKKTERDEELALRYSDDKVNLITVGRIAPNKAQHEIIEMFAVYHNHYNFNSRLIVVGKEDPSLESYNKSIRLMARKFGIEGSVIFTGLVSDEALKTYYELAGVFVILSMHEGFCVPLIEAMAMEVPIVAYASTAIPETVENCGIVWDKRDPELIAASIHRIVSDKRAYTSLRKAGVQRYEMHFTNERIERSLFDAFVKAGLL